MIVEKHNDASQDSQQVHDLLALIGSLSRPRWRRGFRGWHMICSRSDGHTDPVSYDMPDGDVLFFEHLFDHAESDHLYQKLHTAIQWQQDKIELYGRTMDLPRLTAWYGDPGKSYTYSGISMRPHAWTRALLQIKKRIEEEAEVEFSGVLLNLYRTGRDSVGWHSDNERELGRNPVIGSVSFGETRMFQMKHLTRKKLPRVEIPLGHGSFLLMRCTTQHYWEHQVPKTAQTVEPRINLTFRVIR